MDLTPVHNDSGYLSSSTTSASSAKRVLLFPTESTPSTSLTGNRKRRSEPHVVYKTRKLSDILEHNLEFSPIHSSTKTSVIYEQSNSSDSCFTHSLSDSEKLTSSLERCSLEYPYSPKKIKYDDIPKRKSSSAPGTPQRDENDSDKENSFRKFYSLDLTPPKRTVKIGTPERLGILYPTLKEVKSPVKVRFDLKRLKKPAKKRLFHKDFVYIFSEMYKAEHIIFKIFSFLNNTDLVNVAKVSKLWKRSLENHMQSYKRYKTHLRNITVRKENTYNTQQTQAKAIRVRKDPCSPSRVNWAKFSRVGAYLTGAQRLCKCMSCSAPAVVERSLARCSAEHCGYIWCTRCGCGDRSPTRVPCQCSAPHSPPGPLHNISNTPPCPDDLYYLDKTAPVDKNCNSYKPHALMNCNDLSRRGRERGTVLPSKTQGFDVQQHSEEIRTAKKTLSRRKISEPDSPPRDTYAVGSKQSKRNLRRL